MMKIAVGGSVTFAKQMKEIKEQLEEKGHKVFVTDDLDHYIKDESIKMSFEKEVELSLEYDIIKSFFKKLEISDIFLICNFNKKGIRGYLGVNTLMEMAVAYYLGKKIFLLYKFDKTQSYGVEVSIIQPVILNGDLSKIK